MRRCYECKRVINDTEDCWRDHIKRYFCDECCKKQLKRHKDS